MLDNKQKYMSREEILDVFREVWQSETRSQTAVARYFNVTPAAISQIVNNYKRASLLLAIDYLTYRGILHAERIGGDDPTLASYYQVNWIKK